MITTLQEAKQLVSRPNNDLVVVYESGITADIRKEILYVTKISRGATAALAKRLKGKSDLESAQNVWAFTRQIRYQLDPPGKQFIKTPSRTIYDGFSDCKSYSILISTLLSDLGISNGFRFHAYAPGPVTHIFNFAQIDGKTVYIDACLPKFGTEAAHHYAENVMTQISRLSGPGIMGPNDFESEIGKIGESGIPEIFEINGSDSEYIAELKQYGESSWHDMTQAAVSGPGEGSPFHAAAAEAVSDYIQGIRALQAGDVDQFDQVAGNLAKRIPGRVWQLSALKRRIRSGQATPEEVAKWKERLMKRRSRGIREIGSAVGAIGKRKRRLRVLKKVSSGLKKAAKKAKSTVKTAARKTGSFAKRAGKAALKVGKKVAFFQVRLIIRVLLPKAAPFFLYLFITNPQTIQSLPAKVKRKRKTAERIARFIIRVLGMKESIFMKAVRNGIRRKYKKTPEQVLSDRLKGRPINGIEEIGVVSDVNFVIQIIQKLGQLFGQKPEGGNPSAEDSPSADDWDEAPVRTKRKVLSHNRNKGFRSRGEEPADPADEFAMEQADSRAQDQIDSEPEGTDLEAPLPDAEPDESDAGSF
jgi:hypothetical protein